MNQKPQADFDVPAEVQQQVIRYLLDEMDPAERARLDDELITKPEFSDTMASMEDELIMQYVRGDLAARLVPRFNEVYMNSPARAARVDAARALRRAAGEISAERKPNQPKQPNDTSSLSVRLALASAAAIIVLGAVLWPIWHRSPDHLLAQPEKISHASFSLEPGTTRAGGGVEISLLPGIDEVHFELALPKAAALQTYQVVLGTAEHPEAWKGLAAPRDGRLVAVVPMKALGAGDYTLELQKDGEEVMTFYFRVAK